MCYLIAKKCDVHGCIALKTTHGQHLADFKYALDNAGVGYAHIVNTLFITFNLTFLVFMGLMLDN